MIYGLNADFMNLMILNVEVLFYYEPEWLCMIMNIDWFWIEPWAGMAVCDYQYWLVLDWTVSRMAEMDVDPWMRMNACICWIIDNCDFCTSTIGDEGFPG